VAAAKMLGLMTLRVADDIILPLNISQYSAELSSYLHKVASIADSLNVSDQLEFGKLKTSIARVQNASVALDKQAATALEKLHKLVPLPPRGPGCHRGLKSLWRRSVRMIKTSLGLRGERREEADEHYVYARHLSEGKERREHHDKHLHKHDKHDKHGKHDKHHHKHGKHGKHGKHHPAPHMPDPKKVKEIRKVLLEIRGINQKLARYESG
jgi:N-acetylated-alpha-linked acidic dipeptidase